ncbi:MAG: hypothetical protein FJ098_10080 [Deltaproteobacteria bacterium]|nr:hypothetical protein [Deltaproteobacteria bacterium]
MKRIMLVVVAVAFLFAIGCGESGEKLWGKACDHAIELMKKSDEMKEVPKDQLDKTLEGFKKECTEEFKKVGGKDADEAAKCVLKLDKFDPKKFSECEPKKKDEKKEEKKEEAK